MVRLILNIKQSCCFHGEPEEKDGFLSFCLFDKMKMSLHSSVFCDRLVDYLAFYSRRLQQI